MARVYSSNEYVVNEFMWLKGVFAFAVASLPL